MIDPYLETSRPGSFFLIPTGFLEFSRTSGNFWLCQSLPRATPYDKISPVEHFLILLIIL
jgi:hypothetical protein